MDKDSRPKEANMELDTGDKEGTVFRKGANGKNGRCFFFEECWGDDIECKRIVEEVWKSQSGWRNSLYDVLGKFDDCGKKLEKWNFKKQEGMRKDINSKRLALSRENKDGNGMNWKQIGRLKEELDSTLEIDERYWGKGQK
ncbi:hypothetical protein LWI28_004135 [Acer negundo]|uniref:Uncharacterized protein n=1 Tax=Acer negundo TaxID=4023 RepID=A0AAD5JIE4_ACENE|nr:hypothetical protein LWI28_004135 [Acer negundo]